MNLNNQMPLEFYKGYGKLYPLQGEYSKKGGPILKSSYRLGEVQLFKLSVEMMRRSEDGRRNSASFDKLRPDRESFKLIFK